MSIEGEDEKRETGVFIYTHKKLDIGFNNNQVSRVYTLCNVTDLFIFLHILQIIEVNLTSESKTRLRSGDNLDFSYEVNWKASSTPFNKRFDKYLDPSFFQHRVRIYYYYYYYY